MDFDPNWDINKYRYHYELPHHWELKKKFILYHKNRFPEDRLVCFAQIFCNVHYLGCRYGEEIMQLIDELTQGLTGRNEKFESKSFALASDAVEAKVKAFTGQTKPPNSNFNTVRRTAEPIPFVRASERVGNGSQPVIDLTDSPTQKRPQESSYDGEPSRKFGRYYEDEQPQNQPHAQENQWNQQNRFGNRSQENRQNYNQQNQRSNQQNRLYSFEGKQAAATVRKVVESGPFGKVVVFKSLIRDDRSVAIVDRAASAAHMISLYDFTQGEDQMHSCKLSLDGLYVAHGEGTSQRLAKEAACDLALERLKETSFTIEVKATSNSQEVNVERDSLNENIQRQEVIDTPLAKDNIGSKMLKLMGWTGGGLGKEEQGIEEPLKPYDQNVKRGGLGITNFSDFRKKISGIIEDYARSDSKNELVFSPDFTKAERSTIHSLANKYNLKSRSHGKDDKRRLVIYRKISPLEIVEDLLTCGGETEKYKLIPPNPKMK